MPLPAIPLGTVVGLAGKVGWPLARLIWKWSRGSEPRRLVRLLKKNHPAAKQLLRNPEALLALWTYAGSGHFDRDLMLSAVQEVEPNRQAAGALTDAIHDLQWRTKQGDELVHFEVQKALFELRRDISAKTEPILERVEQLQTSLVGSPVTPHHLPAARGQFTNRVSERSEAVTRIREKQGSAQARAPVVVMFGPSGVGKSTLALRIAHDIASDFPDGQLFLNLRAADGTPVGPSEAAARLLRQLDIPDTEIPSDAGERASKLRSIVFGRRLLVVLDNVAAHDMLLELVPASSSCCVLMTTSAAIASLDADLDVLVDSFTEDEGIELLTAIVGANRITDDRSAALMVVQLCGCLPLWIRAVGDWLRRETSLRISDALERLLRSGFDPSGNEPFALNQALLSPAAAQLFRALGSVRSSVASFQICSALAAVDPRKTRLLVEEIHRAGLVDLRDNGVQFHERARAYALTELMLRERELSRAHERMRTFLLSGAETASHRLRQGGPHG